MAQNIGQNFAFSVEFCYFFLGEKVTKNREKIAVLFAEQSFDYHSINRAFSHVNFKTLVFIILRYF